MSIQDVRCQSMSNLCEVTCVDDISANSVIMVISTWVICTRKEELNFMWAKLVCHYQKPSFARFVSHHRDITCQHLFGYTRDIFSTIYVLTVIEA